MRRFRGVHAHLGSSASLPCIVGFAFRFRCVGPVLGFRARVRAARRGCHPWGRRHALVHLSQVVSAQVSWQGGITRRGTYPLSWEALAALVVLADLGNVAVASC